MHPGASASKGMMTDRIICGWRVRSALPLPETATWCGPDRPVDIEIRPGQVPMKHDKQNYIQVVPGGGVLLDLSPIVRFLVTQNCVVVDTPRPPEAPDWRVRFLGPALGVLCYLRGVLPLHACCVRIGTRTVAIAGPSCAGKSTLAAALMRRDHRLVTDDICAISSLSERPIVLPSFPTLKLDPDTVKMFGIDPTSLVNVWLDTEKFLLPGNDGFDPAPLPLDTVYLLEDASEGADHTIIRINGIEAFEQLSAQWYRAEIGRLLYTKLAFFSMAAQLAGRFAVRRLVRKSGFVNLAGLVRLIEADAMSD
jgi:hypothetical protein